MKRTAVHKDGFQITEYAMRQYARRVLSQSVGKSEALAAPLRRECIEGILEIMRNGEALTALESTPFLNSPARHMLRNLRSRAALRTLQASMVPDAVVEHTWGRYVMHDNVVAVVRNGVIRSVIVPTERQLELIYHLRTLREEVLASQERDQAVNSTDVDAPPSEAPPISQAGPVPYGTDGLYVLAVSQPALPGQGDVLNLHSRIGVFTSDLFVQRSLLVYYNQLRKPATPIPDAGQEKSRRDFLWFLHRLVHTLPRKALLICDETSARVAVHTLRSLLGTEGGEAAVLPNHVYCLSAQKPIKVYTLT